MTEEKKTGWLSRLRAGLKKSSNKLSENIVSVLTKKKLDDEALEQLEEALLMADLGPAAAARLVADFGKTRFGKDVSETEIKEALAEQITVILQPVAHPLVIDRDKNPFVVLMVGVNGAGKTTTIGKLAQHYKQQGLQVLMAAGDTFRAAAVGQLKIWGERTGVPVVSGDEGCDAAALAYQAMERARKDAVDLLLIDTAGRLHNKNDLMQELAKIIRVIKKQDESAPHAILLVLDATTGQNAHAQVESFREMAQVTGLVVTKLDGSAKGGVLVALADKFKLPVHAIGVGETADDLQAFRAEDFARSLMGLEGDAA
ncbi:MAG: signal recognition particle-docking protein FtsY [Alphaproteobacteria bacterium]|nr:signal recognition particle-docking protein FtsY [Alphaproteobacteria bacterium]MBV8549578.1 signal recognition particle-docking protein FtsY [Alphaproteobacteria bacterium]